MWNTPDSFIKLITRDWIIQNIKSPDPKLMISANNFLMKTNHFFLFSSILYWIHTEQKKNRTTSSLWCTLLECKDYNLQKLYCVNDGVDIADLKFCFLSEPPRIIISKRPVNKSQIKIHHEVFLRIANCLNMLKMR